MCTLLLAILSLAVTCYRLSRFSVKIIISSRTNDGSIHSQGRQIKIFQDYILSALYFQHLDDLLPTLKCLSESLRSLDIVAMHVCLFVHVFVCVLSVAMCACCLYVSVCVHSYVCGNVCVCTHSCMCVCVVSPCIAICVCACVCVTTEATKTFSYRMNPNEPIIPLLYGTCHQNYYYELIETG